MTMRQVFMRGVMGVVLLSASAGYTMDNGAPIYLDNQEGALRVEAIYDSFDRDVKVGSVNDNMDQDVYMLRLHVVNDVAVTYFDAGTLDDDRTDGGTPAVVGAGVYYLLYDSEYVRLNALVNGHYVPKYDTKNAGGFKGDVKYYEFAAALVLSGKFNLMQGALACTPYAGGGYSQLRGTYNVKLEPAVDGVSKLDYDIEERDPVVGMAGLAVVFSDRVTARVEYDFLSDSSISCALGVSF